MDRPLAIPQNRTTEFKLMIAQIKPVKSNYGKNIRRIGEIFEQIAKEQLQCDVLCLPETFTTGYFLEGGVKELSVTRDQLLQDLKNEYQASGLQNPIDITLGFYELAEGSNYNSGMYACLSLEAGSSKILHVHRKFFLPTYGVFDEKRFISHGRSFDVFDTRFGKAAILICEDIWHSVSASIAALKGAEVIYVLSASPGRGFGSNVIENAAKYEQLLISIAEEHNVFVINSSLVGFEGGKGFIGHSMALNPFGKKIIYCDHIEECLLNAIISTDEIAIARASSPLLSDLKSRASDIAKEFLFPQNELVHE